MDAGTGSLLLTANVAHMWRGCYGSDGFRCGKTYSRDFRLLLLLLPLQVTPTLSLSLSPSLSLSLVLACLLAKGFRVLGDPWPEGLPPMARGGRSARPLFGEERSAPPSASVYPPEARSLSLSLPPSAHIDSRKHGLS